MRDVMIETTIVIEGVIGPQTATGDETEIVTDGIAVAQSIDAIAAAQTVEDITEEVDKCACAKNPFLLLLTMLVPPCHTYCCCEFLK